MQLENLRRLHLDGELKEGVCFSNIELLANLKDLRIWNLKPNNRIELKNIMKLK